MIGIAIHQRDWDCSPETFSSLLNWRSLRGSVRPFPGICSLSALVGGLLGRWGVGWRGGGRGGRGRIKEEMEDLEEEEEYE